MQITLENQKIIKGIIFDMDGTMVDNMMVHHRAWQRKLAELGLDMTLEEVRQSIHGVNEEILERLFGDRYTRQERLRLSDEKEAAYREIFLPELKLVTGLPEFLSQVQTTGIPFGIGTAAPVENVDFVLDNLNLRPMFRTVVHAGMVSKGKPNPEVFEKVAEGLGIPAADCLVFEDSVTGVETAKNAGSTAIAVTTTHTIDEFAHLPNVLAGIRDFTAVQLKQVNEKWHLSIGK